MKTKQKSIFVRILEFLGALCLFVILMLVFADVFLRYIFNAPLGSAPEIVAFCMGFGVFIAFVLVTKDQAHIVVGIFEKFFKGIGIYIHKLIVMLYSLVFVAFICWLMFRQANTMRKTNYISEYMSVPMAPIVFTLSAFAGIAFIVFLPVVWRYIRKGESPDSEQKKPEPK